jgi:hypothetical protein
VSKRSSVLWVSSVVNRFPAKLPQAVELMKQKFNNRGRCCGLTDPEKEHPLDDFGFHFRSVLFGHQSFGQIDFLLMKSEFQAFGNSPSFWRLYISGFQNTKNLCGAHGKNLAKNIILFLTSVHSDLLNLGKEGAGQKS